MDTFINLETAFFDFLFNFYAINIKQKTKTLQVNYLIWQFVAKIEIFQRQANQNWFTQKEFKKIPQCT